MKVPTPHNGANLGDIARTVLMPGDPLRAKYIAQKYLTDVVCYNEVRNMLGFTGKYKGVKISVQGSGMGVPSMGVYSKELFEGYNVENIIRIGSAGSLANEVASNYSNNTKLNDILVADNVFSDSNYIKANKYNDIKPVASSSLLLKLNKVLEKTNINVKIGNIYTSDTFYMEKELLKEISKKDILGVEMETLALYTNARVSNKNAIAMFTVTDNIIMGQSVSSEERLKGLDKMIELALELAHDCEKDR